MTYYHNLKPSIEDTMGDFAVIRCYDTVNTVPLVEYQEENTGKIARQFLQAVIPDSNGNRHIFLALKDAKDVVYEKTLWTKEEINDAMSHHTNKN
jgi:hypothetical protein